MPPKEDSQDSSQSRNDETPQIESNAESQRKEREGRSAAYSKARSQKPSSATKLGERFGTVGTLGMIPILLAVGPIIGIFIGQWLDEKFETAPWLTVIFVILGFVAGSREMYLLVKRENAKEKQKNKTESSEKNEQD